jgi:two-component system chemotaxis response regulator CheB
MIVDDSAVVREVLTEILEKKPDIQVIGAAPNPVIARQKMDKNWPDVLILDVEMPQMDGITFLRQLMNERPVATVICSTLSTAGADTSLRAMQAGAVCVIAKPTLNLSGALHEQSDELTQAVRAAAGANLKRIQRGAQTPSAPPAFKVAPKYNADVILEAPRSGARVRTGDAGHVIAIGTSTGGTQALEYVLPRLPRTVPGLVIVQHMPEAFTRSFAERLDAISAIEVREAQHGDKVKSGCALIAPGNRHMLLKRYASQYCVEVIDGPHVSRHRPSVDVLFRSVAKFAGANALGVIMTGMGDDGARGLKEMRDAGAQTVAQDEESCVVFGMPQEAIKHGGAGQIASLDDIPKLIARAFA